MSYIIWSLILLSIFIALYKIFELTGEKGWKAFVPGYNILVWLKIIHKPWWWIFLLIFPGPNVLMLCIMSANTATVFNRREPKDMAFSGFLPFVYLPLLAFKEKVTYVGPIDRKKFKKNQAQEWRDAILFAVVAASIIRTYSFEAYTIPTPSMEGTMLVGDYLFVSKMTYGPRVPETPLSFPFAHHTLPLTTDIPSYLEWITLPGWRMPGWSDVERNDIVVFNYPEGDTVINRFQANKSYEAYLNELAFQYRRNSILAGNKVQSDEFYRGLARKEILRAEDITVRPVDKRENYIKRCVAVAGDDIEIKSGQLYVNGEKSPEFENMQHTYYVQTKTPLPKNYRTAQYFKSTYNVNFDYILGDNSSNPVDGQGRLWRIPLAKADLEKIKNDPDVAKVEREVSELASLPYYMQGLLGDPRYKAYTEETNDYDPLRRIFPNHINYKWTEDHFGPLHIPAAGETVTLTTQNLPLYQRIIRNYELNELNVKGGKIYINGKETTTYTFNMNYYWLMGDNRHNSMDSRFWGFVPENHVVGKASFIWMSLDPELGWSDGKVRFDRLFSFI